MIKPHHTYKLYTISQTDNAQLLLLAFLKNINGCKMKYLAIQKCLLCSDLLLQLFTSLLDIVSDTPFVTALRFVIKDQSYGNVTGYSIVNYGSGQLH